MAISRIDVLHVARLAKLRLEEHEIARMERDLGEILRYVELLSELDVRDVPPTAQVAVQATPFRRDEARPGLDVEEALAEAPRRSDRSFAVPAFVEE
jgi:aspartyl-tRNA(Asn)/glutamyl-tRNA(Gln) amidotransferase subunit C